jgi:hypothetical protein
MTLDIPGKNPPQKVDQTFTSDKDGFGNCLQACVATLFSLDITEVVDLRPTRITQKESQKLRLDCWLKEHGWAVHRVQSDLPYRGYYIASGLVRRSIYIHHAVVMKDGHLYHDPHQGREGLCTQSAVYLFYPLPKGIHYGVDAARTQTVFQFHPSSP